MSKASIDTKNSIDKPITRKKSTTTRKRPTLSQRLEQKNKVIEELTAEISEKNHRINKLNEENKILDEISERLRKAEQVINENKPGKKDHPENAELIDDLTDKLKELEINLVDSSFKEKHSLARNIVKTNMLAAGSLSLLPLPLFDFAALFGVQLNLVRNLCKHYEVNFDEIMAKTVLKSLVGSALPLVSVMALSSFIRIIPGIGTIGGSISMGIFSSAFIYATGEVFIRHFERGGTLQDFNSKHWKSIFKKNFEKEASKAK